MESPANSPITTSEPSRPENPLSAALYDALKYQRALPREGRITHMGSLEFDRLEALSRVEQHVPDIKSDLDTIRTLLSVATQSAPTAEQGVELREAYNRCLEMVFPVGQKYLH